MKNEINPVDLWQIFIQSKLTFSIFLILSVVLGVMYSVYATPVYRSEGIIAAPLSNDLDFIKASNISLERFDEFSKINIFKLMLENLKTSETQEKLLQNPSLVHYLTSTLELDEAMFYGKLDDLFTLDVDKQVNDLLPGQQARVLFTTNDPVLSKQVVTWLLEAAAETTKKQIIGSLSQQLDSLISIKQDEFSKESSKIQLDLQSRITKLQENDAISRKEIEAQIAALKESSKMKTEFEIERLRTDYEIAKSLNITQPIDPFDYKRDPQSEQIRMFNNSPFRYWLGTTILKKEISSLENRKNENAFIPNLADMYRKLHQLRSNPEIDVLKNRDNNLMHSNKLRQLKSDMEQVKTIKTKLISLDLDTHRIIKTPNEPPSPIKPNKPLIILLSALIGGVLGVLCLLSFHMFRQRPQH